MTTPPAIHSRRSLRLTAWMRKLVPTGFCIVPHGPGVHIVKQNSTSQKALGYCLVAKTKKIVIFGVGLIVDG